MKMKAFSPKNCNNLTSSSVLRTPVQFVIRLTKKKNVRLDSYYKWT